MIGINAYELKQYIIDSNKIFDVLEGMGCHSIKSYPTEYRSALPNETNSSKVSIKKDTLSCKVFGGDKVIRGDIITLDMELSNLDFISSLKHLHNLLGIEFNKIDAKQNKKEKDILAIFKKAKQSSTYKKSEIKTLDENVLDKYIKLPHIDFVKEGIMPKIQDQFDIRYDYKSRRILIPHRHWSTGELIGVIGRTTIENYDLFDIPKYFPIKSYPKSQNLFGLYENYKSIQEAGYVVLFEGEKSCLKANTYQYPVGVAFCGIAGEKLSDEQVKILISLDVDIIVALDKGISEETSISICNQFKGIRNTYYIYDKHGLLKDKDAPIDKGLKIWKYLLKYKIKVG